MEGRVQVTAVIDPDYLTMLPSPAPLEGQEIQDYLNENSLTIVDIGKIRNLQEQLTDQLKEFEEKEKKWEDNRAELKTEVTRLQCREKLLMTQNKKMMECIRKIAEITAFHHVKQCPSKNDSNCEFVQDEVLSKFSEHAKIQFEKVS